MNLSTLPEAIADYCKTTNETVNFDDYTVPVNQYRFNPTTNKYLLVLPSNELFIFAIVEYEGLSYEVIS